MGCWQSEQTMWANMHSPSLVMHHRLEDEAVSTFQFQDGS